MVNNKLINAKKQTTKKNINIEEAKNKKTNNKLVKF